MNGDGRLDLDDLGGVIEHASSIDQPVDVVVGDDSGRTWGERLESAGISPWLRRHRVAVAVGTATVLVVGVGATAWVRAQPPAWREPSVEVVAAVLDSNSGMGMRRDEDGTASAAYVVTAADAGTAVHIEGVEGPGIRASTVSPPLPTGDAESEVVRAAFGCDDDALLGAPDEYRLRLTVTDAWGRSSTTFTSAPAEGGSWRDAVVQGCWPQAVLTRVVTDDVAAAVDEGAAAVNLRVTVTSTLPGQVAASLDGYLGESTITPTGVGTELPAGVPTTVSGRLDVWDCSAGTPGVPQVSLPDDPTKPTYYRTFEGVALQVYSPDRNSWSLAPVAFTPNQSAELRRALAGVCAGAPEVRVDRTQVVRRISDDGTGNASLVLVVDVDLPDGRLAQVGISQDYTIAFPDPATSLWSIAPRGGGRAEATWTFSCFAVPAPPSLDVRFVDGIRPTPVRVRLDQETLAPWVSDTCPDMTADLLVESGWQLP